VFVTVYRYQEVGAEGSTSQVDGGASSSAPGEAKAAATAVADVGGAGGAVAVGAAVGDADQHGGMPGHTLGSVGAMALIATKEEAPDVAPLMEVGSAVTTATATHTHTHTHTHT
jgi:hypothetical protein